MKKFLPLLILFFLLTITSCSKEEIEEPEIESYYELLTDYEKEIVSYFEDVALGFEFGNSSRITRKWAQPMKIFVGGEPSTALEEELHKITTEINGLATDGFQIEIVTDTLQSNYYIFLGSGQDYASIFPEIKEYIESNWGLFTVYYNGNNNFYKGNMYVDLYRTTSLEAKKHLLREELTQSLGLARDSELYEESIFQLKWTTITQYSNIDRELIQLLYHPEMRPGLNSRDVKEVLAKILLE
ncbi:DUF2927 domain-containing protein [Salinimicrobium terrae]|uniref:DUF2927 domain-containing protein n=1 Tax=Salinimicrobium terrae TaxID=470866 RepID=UPI000418C00F|nr:DUF2927 domain-containing protein [Salinimicrobium terrae]